MYLNCLNRIKCRTIFDIRDKWSHTHARTHASIGHAWRAVCVAAAAAEAASVPLPWRGIGWQLGPNVRTAHLLAPVCLGVVAVASAHTKRRRWRLICMRNWSQHLLHIAASQHQPNSLHTHTHTKHTHRMCCCRMPPCPAHVAASCGPGRFSGQAQARGVRIMNSHARREASERALIFM